MKLPESPRSRSGHSAERDDDGISVGSVPRAAAIPAAAGSAGPDEAESVCARRNGVSCGERIASHAKVDARVGEARAARRAQDVVAAIGAAEEDDVIRVPRSNPGSRVDPP